MDLNLELLNAIDSFVWGPPLLVLLVGTGILLTLRLKLLQVFQLGMDFGLVGCQLLAALAGLLGLLLQPQHLHLQLVLAGLGLGGLGAGGGQVAHALGVLGLGTGQGAAGLVRNQGVGAHLLVQVLDFLRPRQQAGLLGVGGVEGQAVARHGMSCRGVNGLTGLQAFALGQGFFQRGGGVAAFLLNRIKPLNVSVCKKWVGVVAAANLLRYRGVGCDTLIFDGISSR